jgi:anthranilate synthase component 2
MKPILVLDNYDSFTYNLVHYAEKLGFEVNVFRNDQISINEVDKYDKIILSPGPGLPDDAGILKELIHTYTPTKKILGVCLGMQAMGEVFGGKLENLSNVFHGVATDVKVIDQENSLFKDVPNLFKIGRYHSWIISSENFPEELKITSIDDNNQIMSLKHKNYDLYGVQFHPESILTEYGKEIIKNFLEL